MRYVLQPGRSKLRAVCVSALVNYSYEVLVILNLTDSACVSCVAMIGRHDGAHVCIL
jgi:hypothetical protein